MTTTMDNDGMVYNEDYEEHGVFTKFNARKKEGDYFAVAGTLGRRRNFIFRQPFLDDKENRVSMRILLDAMKVLADFCRRKKIVPRP